MQVGLSEPLKERLSNFYVTLSLDDQRAFAGLGESRGPSSRVWFVGHLVVRFTFTASGVIVTDLFRAKPRPT